MNNDQYENLIVLLKKALEFYANESNYMPVTLNASLFAPVHLDHGTQARFALDKSKEIVEFNSKITEDYNKLLEDVESTGETNPLELIKYFNQTHDGENNNV